MTRTQIVFAILGGFFITNALVAEMIGAKLIYVGEPTWRLGPFGPFAMSVGIIPWPVVFVTTDLVNEYFGRRGVRRLTLLTVLMIAYVYVILMLTMRVPATPFSGVDNTSYNKVFGQSRWIIVGSITAFMISAIRRRRGLPHVAEPDRTRPAVAALHRFDGRVADDRQHRGAVHRAGAAAAMEIRTVRECGDAELPREARDRVVRDAADLPRPLGGGTLPRASPSPKPSPTKPPSTTPTRSRGSRPRHLKHLTHLDAQHPSRPPSHNDIRRPVRRKPPWSEAVTSTVAGPSRAGVPDRSSARPPRRKSRLAA